MDRLTFLKKEAIRFDGAKNFWHNVSANPRAYGIEDKSSKECEQVSKKYADLIEQIQAEIEK